MKHNFLWLDLETTGLDPKRDRIVEVAAAIVDDGPDGTFSVDRAYNGVVAMGNVPFDALVVDPIVRDMHRELRTLCAQSTLSLGDLENGVLNLIDAFPPDRKIELAGFSVHFDLAFIREHMPRLAERLSHRVFDVSTLKTAARLYCDFEVEGRKAHRAMLDVNEAIDAAYSTLAIFCGLPDNEVVVLSDADVEDDD